MALGVHGKPKLTETEKGETGEEQSQEHAHHFSLTSKNLVTEELAVVSRQIAISDFLFHQGTFYQTHDCHPHPPYFSLYPNRR
jgi:hypothetical protein